MDPEKAAGEIQTITTRGETAKAKWRRICLGAMTPGIATRSADGPNKIQVPANHNEADRGGKKWS